MQDAIVDIPIGLENNSAREHQHDKSYFFFLPSSFVFVIINIKNLKPWSFRFGQLRGAACREARLILIASFGESAKTSHLYARVLLIPTPLYLPSLFFFLTTTFLPNLHHLNYLVLKSSKAYNHKNLAKQKPIHQKWPPQAPSLLKQQKILLPSKRRSLPKAMIL